MKRVTGVILVVLVGFGLFAVGQVWAAQPSLLIVGLQTGGANSAAAEFIEIANTSNQPVNLATAKLEYFSAGSDLSRASRSIGLSGQLGAGERLLLTTKEYTDQPGQQVFKATLATDGGHLRLTSNSVQDLVGWGTAGHALGHPALSPATGERLVRRTTADGQYMNSGDNSSDFILQGSSELKLATVGNVTITELLPDPASPATDREGEFIELHNNSDQTVNLKNFTLAVGKRKFKLPDYSLSGREYKAWYSGVTKLTLTNSGSRVQLLSPGGQNLSDTSYGQVASGRAWAWDGLVWQWTTKPTPDAANTFIIPPVLVAKTKTNQVKTRRKASAKKGRVKSSQTKIPVLSDQPKDNVKQPVHTSVVAGVGSLAVLYGAYEYRQDLADKFRKFREHRSNRPKTRP